jgi:amino acid transporter
MDVNKTDQMVKEQITKDVEEFSMISADVQNGAIESMDYAFDTEPEMKKQFNTLSLIGLGFAIACSWAGFSSSASAALLYSGTSGMVYAFPIASFFMGIIALGMAEMSSTFPSSSGQQHWVYMLSPEKFKIPLSYFAGWISMLSWWFIGVSVSSVCMSCEDI